MFHHTCLEKEQEAMMWSMVSGSWSHKKQCSLASNPCQALLFAVQWRFHSAIQRKILNCNSAHVAHSRSHPGVRCTMFLL
jgi:hypothetical protein